MAAKVPPGFGSLLSWGRFGGDGKGIPMRSILAAAMIALMAVAAHAQGMGGGKHRHGRGQDSQNQKKKPSEANYKSPLEQLPDQTYDPWRNIRSAEPPKGEKAQNCAKGKRAPGIPAAA